MESSNDFPSSPAEKTDNQGHSGCQHAPATRWMMNSVYGVAGLVMLALVITVVSPETAVAVSRYLPENFQQSLFATVSGSHRCCGKGSRTHQTSPVPTGACGSSGESTCPVAGTCPLDTEMAVAEIDFMPLSLDEMLAGIDAAPTAP